MSQRRAMHCFGLLILAALLVLGAACDDDEGDDSTVTPSADASATSAPTQRPSATATVNPSTTLGPAATLELRADPQELACDGEQASAVTARVLDAAGYPVEDGTRVTFNVQVLGSADPINAETLNGEATTSVIALAEGAGVVVNVTSGDAAASIRVDCS
jgi:hypothetical protein